MGTTDEKNEPSVVVTRPAYNIASFDKRHKNISQKEHPLSVIDRVGQWGRKKFTFTKSK